MKLRLLSHILRWTQAATEDFRWRSCSSFPVSFILSSSSLSLSILHSPESGEPVLSLVYNKYSPNICLLKDEQKMLRKNNIWARDESGEGMSVALQRKVGQLDGMFVEGEEVSSSGTNKVASTIMSTISILFSIFSKQFDSCNTMSNTIRIFSFPASYLDHLLPPSWDARHISESKTSFSATIFPVHLSF